MSTFNMNKRTKQQAGFGLVEMMIGMLVGLIVVAAATSMLSTTMATSNDNIKMTRLDQGMRQVMTMLSRDLKRATLWDPAVDVTRVSQADPLTLSGNTGVITVTSSGGNLANIGDKAINGTLVYKNGTTVYRGSITAFDPASGGSYSVTISTAWPATVVAIDGVTAGSWNILRPESTLALSGTCVLFAYDLDANGKYALGERFGYRYDATNKAVQIRTSAAITDTCTSGGSWENITDENTVEILDLDVDGDGNIETAFSVTDNSPAVLTSSGFSVAVREFTIRMTGRLKADPSVMRTLQETIRVRNDRLS